MGKRRENDFDSTDNSISPPKRHKKHKKHKKKKPEYDSDSVDVVNDIPMTPVRDSIQNELIVAEKLKNQPSSSKGTPASTKSQKRKKGKGKESETSSDEERWLDAIESGKLEEVDDELKKIKDPKLMTARQRAMYERGNDKEPSPGGEILMSLPTGYKEKVMTAEAIQKAQIKSQKRKQLADEKREKDKKKTMERLLKKQDSKAAKQGRNKVVKAAQPMISYRNTAEGATVTVPPNFDFPLVAQTGRDPPKPIICSIPGCFNIKSYNCSKTNVPLCSFKCYKKNVAALKQIIC